MLLLDWLVARYPTAKRQTLRRMIEEGRVLINNRPANRPKQEIQATDAVYVIEQKAEPPRKSLAPMRVIHEDADVLVVFKPAGLLTSTVPRERRTTAIAIIRDYFAEQRPRPRAGIVHRLDRDAAGLLVFSKNDAAYADLKRQFFDHTVDRIYTAVVHGQPPAKSGRFESFLVELPDGSVRSTHNQKKGQIAVSEWQFIRSAKGLSMLRIKLRTGRKHQIRAHLSEAGFPIVGDAVYGLETDTGPLLLLAATTLAFDHPRTGERVTLQIPPPREIDEALGGR